MSAAMDAEENPFAELEEYDAQGEVSLAERRRYYENYIHLHNNELRAVRERLAKQSDVVMKLGKMLLSSGASAYRVKHSMARLAHAVGIDELHSQVTFSEIIISAYTKGTFRTESTEQRLFGTNANLLDNLRTYVAQLRPKMLVEEVDRDLEKIYAARIRYQPIWLMLAAGMACAGFCFLNRGGPLEALFAGVAAFLGQMLRYVMMSRKMNHFGTWMLCSFVSCLVYMCLSIGCYHLSLTTQVYQQGIISAILYLVPGFPLVTAILDLVRMDFSAGISRSFYVIMLIMSAGLSAWIALSLFQFPVALPSHYALSGFWLLLCQFLASFVAAYGFAIIFQVASNTAFLGALVAGLVNTTRIYLIDFGLAPQLGTGIAAVMIGFAAHGISRLSKYRISRMSLSVPVVIPMIPGVPLYSAITHLSKGEIGIASVELVQASFVILAIGIGLAIARMLTDPGWRIDRDTAQPYQKTEFIDDDGVVR